MPVENDTRTDAKTGEREIFKSENWQTDWEYILTTVKTDISGLTGSFVFLPAEDVTNHIFEMNGQTLAGGTASYPALATKWPSWVSGADIVLPDWRGRAMMATGALGITGAAGATYSDATAVNGLRTTLRTRSTAGGNAFNEALAAFTNTANLNQQGSVINQMSGDAETRPNAVGLVLCVIAGAPTVLVEGDSGTAHVLITGTLGPGAGGTVNVPLAKDGKALFDVAMKLSNGASFSPPLDTDDGTNRWWYDFDHTTGVITTSRFGAFTGGAYRIVALYQ